MRHPLLLLLAAPLWAQDPLSLRDAVRLALRDNQSIAASAAGIKLAETRIAQARSGVLPRINYSESFARSDNPVFVFGSLLTQHQFTEQNFRIGPLNQPDFLNNFQSLVTLDQMVYDGGQETKHAVRSAQLAHEMSEEDTRRVRLEVIGGVTRAYLGAVLAAESLKTAAQSMRSAEADLARAQAVRDAGLSTDVDVLSIRVHLAAVTEHRIRRAADLDVARAALNDALGLPLEAPHTLTTALAPANLPTAALEGMEREAAETRPEARQTKLALSLAQNQVETARSALRPQISIRGTFEADRQRFVTRGGANWMAGVSLRWNLFDGFANKARIAEGGHAVHRAEADGVRTSSAIRLQVRRAWADFTSAAQRIDVALAAVTQSEESLRITQNRYEAGMSNVTDLLRNETAVLESRARHLAAVHDQRIAATMLEYAAGRLSADSEVLN